MDSLWIVREELVAYKRGLVMGSQISVRSTYVTSHNPLLYATSSSLTISTVLFREADSTSARVHTCHEIRSV